MIFSKLIDTLLDEMYKKDLASKEVEFCTRGSLGLELLSIYENHDGGVYIDIGTNEAFEERNDEPTKTQKAEKIILDWGKAGKDLPPNDREIKNTLERIYKEAGKTNVFNLYGVSREMIQYLKNHFEPENAVIKVVDTDWIMIGTDEKTVQALYDSI